MLAIGLLAPGDGEAVDRDQRGEDQDARGKYPLHEAMVARGAAIWKGLREGRNFRGPPGSKVYRGQRTGIG
jgi:hypothetical protein